MARKINKKGKTQTSSRVVSRGSYSSDVVRIFSFLDGYSKSSEKYNALDIKVDSNLIKER